MRREAFRQHFRLSKRTVQWLCNEFRDELGRRTRGLSVEEEVLCALRFFATGGFRSLVGNEGTISLPQPSVSLCIYAAAITQ